MNQSEKRRRELLNQTRRQYTDWRTPPAVHPRYSAFYHDLYDTEEEPSGTLGLRIMICLILFAVFVVMDYRGTDIAQVSTDRITSMVTHQTSPQEALDFLNMKGLISEHEP